METSILSVHGAIYGIGNTNEEFFRLRSIFFSKKIATQHKTSIKTINQKSLD